MRRRWLPWLLVGGALLPAQAVAPAFATGDVALLECCVTGLANAREVVRLLVEVHNHAAVAAEPLEFVIESMDKDGKGRRSEVYQRVQLPRVGRYGRPAPAGGKQTYQVPTSLPGQRGAHRVTVRSASWCTDGVVPAPQLQFGTPAQVQRESLAGRFPVTEVEVGNPLDRDLDVLVLVTLAQPADTVELMGLRLQAGQKRQWVLSGPPGNRPYVAEDAVVGPLKATAFRVVDWSLVAPADPAAAAKLLRPAYERWYRWADDTPALSGRFVLRERTQKQGAKGGYESRTASGRFTLARDGVPTVQRDEGTADAASGIAEAFRMVRRPDFATLAAKNELVQIAADRVEVRGSGWGAERIGGAMQYSAGQAAAGNARYVQVQGERIVAEGTGDDPPQPWQTEARGPDHLVTCIGTDQVVTRITYGECEGRAVPTTWSLTNWLGGVVFSSWQLEFTELTFAAGAAVAAPAPSGEGAAALRAIWEASYRLPGEAIEITADFEVTQPGTDRLWQGRKKLQGRLRMVGVGRHARSVHCDFTERMAPEIATDLAFMVRDRLLIWCGRDLNARLPFDTVFAGVAVRAKAADGSFGLDGGPIARIQTRDGLITSWRERDGAEARFQWQKVGDHRVMTRFERDLVRAADTQNSRWTEAVQVALAPVGAWLLPAQIRLERTFGNDFGVETITLKNLVAKP